MKELFFILVVIGVLAGVFYFFEGSITGSAVLGEGDLEEIVVPVVVHKIVDDNGAYTSFRDEDNIYELLAGANRIWSAGGISFEIVEIKVTEIKFEDIPNTLNGNNVALVEHENFVDGKINLFLVQSLNGLNGLALVRVDTALVSDFTTVNDYRTTAHEFGHILGLRHVPEGEKLMARGRNGERLEDWEIEIARGGALRLQDL